jgi:hypothetical protein
MISLACSKYIYNTLFTKNQSLSILSPLEFTKVPLCVPGALLGLLFFGTGVYYFLSPPSDERSPSLYEQRLIVDLKRKSPWVTFFLFAVGFLGLIGAISDPTCRLICGSFARGVEVGVESS